MRGNDVKMNNQTYIKLISASETNVGAAVLCSLLTAPELIYSEAIKLRNYLYSKQLLKTYQVGARVFSVGNITTGGTGKTPFVIWLCKQITHNSKLKTQNYKCAIMTRGYKTTQNSKLKTQNYTDEPAILAKNCPQAKIIVNPDRVAGATLAINNYGADILIMDDGFQYRRLRRDLDIVMIDATCPFGYGRMLPAGLLREPISALKRADAAVITRCDQTTPNELNTLEETLLKQNANIAIAKSIHAPICARAASDEEISIEELKQKKIFAFCGIGNPQAFLKTIKALGAELIGSKVFDDHYRYTTDCLNTIYTKAGDCGADLILTTEKDWTKITPFDTLKENKRPKLAYLAVEVRFLAGEQKLLGLIEDALASKILKKKS
jgi:tetraacyldisaccharide 4'-kinase